ncbi:hypothetical protein ACWXVT_00915 [Mycoplasma sp. 1573]
MRKSLKFIFGSLVLTAFLATPMIVTSCDNKTNDLNVSQLEEVFKGFKIEVNSTNNLSFEEFRSLFEKTYKKVNKDIKKVFKDEEIAKSVNVTLFNVNKLSSGHTIEINPVFNNSTKQFKLRVKIIHTAGEYVEGQKDITQVGSFVKKGLSEEERSQAIQSFKNDSKTLLFTLKEDSKYQDFIDSIDTKNVFSSLLKQSVISFKPQTNSYDKNIYSTSYNLQTDDESKTATLLVELKQKEGSVVLYSYLKKIEFKK